MRREAKKRERDHDETAIAYLMAFSYLTLILLCDDFEFILCIHTSNHTCSINTLKSYFLSMNSCLRIHLFEVYFILVTLADHFSK